MVAMVLVMAARVIVMAMAMEAVRLMVTVMSKSIRSPPQDSSQGARPSAWLPRLPHTLCGHAYNSTVATRMAIVQVTSRHVTSRHVTSHHVSSRLVSSRLVSSLLVSSRLVSSRLVSSYCYVQVTHV